MEGCHARALAALAAAGALVSTTAWAQPDWEADDALYRGRAWQVETGDRGLGDVEPAIAAVRLR